MRMTRKQAELIIEKGSHHPNCKGLLDGRPDWNGCDCGHAAEEAEARMTLAALHATPQPATASDAQSEADGGEVRQETLETLHHLLIEIRADAVKRNAENDFLRTALATEREAHEMTRKCVNKLAQRLWDAAEDLHNEREHPGKFHACRVQLCKLDRESITLQKEP